VRSGSRPIAAAAEEVVDASVRVAFAASLQAVTDQGLPLRNADPTALLIETDYVDVTTYRPETSQYPDRERLVRFRVQMAVDPEGSGTRIAFFGIYNPFRSGLSNTRRGERAVPRDHPAAALIREIARKVLEILDEG
jgi:hypothetical protein